MKQLELSGELKRRVEHGGDLWRGGRKRERPIATKSAMHVTLRSSLAKGEGSFLHPRHAPFIRDLLARLSRRFQVRLYETANAGTHLHLLARPKTRDSLKRFLCALSGKTPNASPELEKASPSADGSSTPSPGAASWGRTSLRFVAISSRTRWKPWASSPTSEEANPDEYSSQLGDRPGHTRNGRAQRVREVRR